MLSISWLVVPYRSIVVVSDAILFSLVIGQSVLLSKRLVCSSHTAVVCKKLWRGGCIYFLNPENVSDHYNFLRHRSLFSIKFHVLQRGLLENRKITHSFQKYNCTDVSCLCILRICGPMKMDKTADILFSNRITSEQCNVLAFSRPIWTKRINSSETFRVLRENVNSSLQVQFDFVTTCIKPRGV